MALIASTPLHAQATAPTAQTLQATIRQVVGNVRARTSENDPWKPVQVGQVVNEGTEFITGPKSRVVFFVPPDQTIILDRLGTVKLLIARQAGDEVQTKLGMPYGRTEYQVEQAGLRHNAQITSPGATLAVRGTKNMLLFDQGPFTPIAYASQPVRLRDAKGRTINFGRTGGRAHVAADKNSPGEQALVETRVDPAGAFAGRTAQESALIAYFNRLSPNLDITKFGVFKALLDPNRPTFVGVLPIAGELDFTLFWTTVSVTDLDLTITSPLGEVLSAARPKVNSGGKHTGNEQSIKGQGQEVAIWDNGYPAGTYTITVSQKPTKSSSTVIVDVVKDRQNNGGQRVQLFQFKMSPQTPSVTNTVTVTPSSGSGSAAASRRR